MSGMVAIRTTNLLERLSLEERRRTKISGGGRPVRGPRPRDVTSQTRTLGSVEAA